MTSGNSPTAFPVLFDAALHRLQTTVVTASGAGVSATPSSSPGLTAILTPNPTPASAQSNTQAAASLQPRRVKSHRHRQQQKGLRENSKRASIAPRNAAPLPAVQSPRDLTERYQCYDIALSAPDGSPVRLEEFTSISGRPIFRPFLYLFNVLVALEWIPSQRTLQQLIAGFQAASDFLYDATDGRMAFGQVVFGGMELMRGADIQIMASNRLHPRSWLNALNDEEKYMPIRGGRGVWHKNNRVLIPWDEPEAYRTIIHEWGHYGLNLLDEYLEESKPVMLVQGTQDRLIDKEQAAGRKIPFQPQKYNLVVPKLSLSLESIMATLDGTSEIVPQQRRQDPIGLQDIMQRLDANYPGIAGDLTGQVDEGPGHLPLQLPRFRLDTTDSQFGSGDGEERLITVDDVKLQHCWVYILRWVKDQEGNLIKDQDGHPILDRIIAQGSIDDRARPTEDPYNPAHKLPGAGFWLFGFKEGDELLFIGYNGTGTSSKLKVKRGGLDGADKRYTDPPRWQITLDESEATPPTLSRVTVIPKRLEPAQPGYNTERITKIKVQITGDQLPDEVWVRPLGQRPKPSDKWAQPLQMKPTANPGWGSDFIDVPHLDGQVLLRWNQTDSPQYMVSDYSQGGGPNSNIKAPDPPITAGSSDGNVMFFFAQVGKDNPLNLGYSEIRIVTTRNYGGFEEANGNKEPRSYLFSVAATKGVPVDKDEHVPETENISPTLVMNFDSDALDEGRELIIHRYDESGSTWEPLPTYQPRGAFYAAVPLEPAIDSTEALDPNGRRPIEYYRLFLV